MPGPELDFRSRTWILGNKNKAGLDSRARTLNGCLSRAQPPFNSGGRIFREPHIVPDCVPRKRAWPFKKCSLHARSMWASISGTDHRTSQGPLPKGYGAVEQPTFKPGFVDSSGATSNLRQLYRRANWPHSLESYGQGMSFIGKV